MALYCTHYHPNSVRDLGSRQVCYREDSIIVCPGPRTIFNTNRHIERGTTLSRATLRGRPGEWLEDPSRGEGPIRKHFAHLRVQVN